MPGFTPTQEQSSILEYRPGQHARILAGPGTGKSATVVALVNKLLSGADKLHIRLLTFTRAATGELAKKVSAHPEVITERPSTIHSFAISLLVRNLGAGNLPEPLRLADDCEMKLVVRPTLARRTGVGVKRIRDLITEMSANWQSLKPEENPKITAKERARFQAAWSEHRRIFGYTLLPELPYAARKALKEHGDLEGTNFDLLIVDEYQDLNACDLEVIQLLSERGCSVIGAGDDDQSIYAFRKADPEGIRRFLDDYPGSLDYPLSVTQRCACNIIKWASYVIEADLDRPHRPCLSPAEGSPDGEVALLSFAGQISEASGIAQLVQCLINQERLKPEDILILLRGDSNGRFSKPIKEKLAELEIPYCDPDAIKKLLSEKQNRRMLEALRLLANQYDSVAWASLLTLTHGISKDFVEAIYNEARSGGIRFGDALLTAHKNDFPNTPQISRNNATRLIEDVLSWIESHELPETGESADGWGKWIISMTGGDVVPAPTAELQELLLSLDGLTEPETSLDRYLGQIAPLGQDLEANESQGVRIMSMAAAKGLTVKATIIGGAEDDIVPRPECDLSEERRLLYVAMTRAREFLYATWAKQRTGPTARSGAARVGGRRTYSSFLQDGPVESEDGNSYIKRRWPSR